MEITQTQYPKLPIARPTPRKPAAMADLSPEIIPTLPKRIPLPPRNPTHALTADPSPAPDPRPNPKRDKLIQKQKFPASGNLAPAPQL